MEKTIKQMADDLGIDKQKVYRFIVKNHITASREVMQTKWYDEAVQSLVKSHFDHITASNERCGDAPQKTQQRSSHDVLLEGLMRELEVKNEQLKEKDRQIAEKDKQLAEKDKQIERTQLLLDQQQQLNAVAVKQVLCLEEKKDEEVGAAPQKKTFIQRLFGL